MNKKMGDVMFKNFISALASIILSANLAFTGEIPHIKMFSPEGTAKEVRQVTAGFSEQMVPFGDPRLGDPFNIQCAEKGKGRWVDGKTWSYDFERDIPAGIACTFTLKSNVKTLKGSAVAGQHKFSFNTGGPSVLDSRPDEGNSWIDERQIFILSLNAQADEASIIQNVYFSIEGVKERVGIRLIKGEEKERLLKEIKYRQDKMPNVALQCRQAFPPRSEVKIVWAKGIKSVGNIPTTEDQVLIFKTRTPFNAKFGCMKERPDAACIPITPMKLTFSAPVSWDTAKKITLKSKDGKIWEPKKEDAGSMENTEGIIFQGPFPEKTSFTVNLPGHIKDDAGRLLANQGKFPISVKTDSYPALAKFPSRFGIIEMQEGAALPLTVRNIEAEIKTWLKKAKEPQKEPKQKIKEVVPDKAESATGKIMPDPAKETDKGMEKNLKGKLHKVKTGKEEQIITWLGIMASAQREKPVLKDKDDIQALSIPKPGGSKEFEVIGIPLKDHGFYIVELESRMLGSRLLKKPGPMYVPAAVLVTNLAAHFKWGRESSIVWVTTLDKGEPVSGASITLRDCKGKIVWEGTTAYNGVARINTALPPESTLPRCDVDRDGQGEFSPAISGIRGGLFVFATKEKDMTFTHSSWDEGIEPWRFNLSGYHDSKKADFIAHTVFDRTLLRAGEEIHMKHFVRERTMKGFFVPSGINKFEEVVIEHAGSEQQYSFPLKWRPNGTAETSFKIPDKTKLGTYEVYFTEKRGNKKAKPNERLNAGSFRVEEFRVPLMKALIQGPKEPLINTKELDVDISISYLSGGGASSLPIKVRTDVQPKNLSFEDFEGYDFSGGRVKTGIAKSHIYEDEEESENTEGTTRRRKLQTMELTLDKAGAARAKISKLPESDTPNDVLIELEYADPNGETQTVSSKIPLYPSKLLVGINAPSQNISTDTLKYDVVVVDTKGKPVPDSEVKVNIYQKKTYSHRRRIAGGFYAYDNTTETKLINQHCQGRTDKNGLLACEGKPPVTGEALLQAEVIDDQGNHSVSNQSVWIPGKDDQWSEARNDDRIDLIPEKRRYEPGENARFQVKMPFREATALITVEREGIADVYIKKLTRNDPFIELPIKENYVPNIFVSALLVKGRSPDIKPTAFFDPGKPAYKLGISEIKVGWLPHELKVKVSTDKKVYNVRDQVEVKIKAETASGQKLPSGSEITVAVVDEGLLELKPNQSWKLLEAMMRKKGYEVKTSTAQMMVVGKRHFGRKALPHGGGGGRQMTRELFDTLVYWKGIVVLDENGEASLKFPLNDSLTSFRVVAVAGSNNLFGTGEASIRTTQDLMMLSGLPLLVREGDRFTAGFTIRNASQREMKVEARLALKDISGKKEVEPSMQVIAAGEAREIYWEIPVPDGITKIEYEASIKEVDGKAGDSLKFTQKVIEAVKVRTFQATLAQIKGALSIKMEIPEDAVKGKGGIDILMKPRLSDGLAGITEYMGNYPYTCLEQRLSKAVALRDRDMWKAIMAELPSYLDEEGLVKYFPVMRLGNDVLTSYLLSISREAGYDIPEGVRGRILKGLKEFIEGKIIRYSNLPTADLSIRKMAALEALSQYNEAQPELLGSIAVEANIWPTSGLLDWINVLMRVKNIPDRAKKLKEAEHILRSRLNLQGTVMGISTEKTDNLWWLMATPDTNAVKLLLTTLKFDNWKEDNPRIFRGMLGRMKKGHWDTTIANAWGVLAIEKFTKIFESTPVAGVTSAKMDLKTESVDWTKTPKGGNITFPWPKKTEALNIIHKGNGSPWAVIRSLAGISLKESLFSGFKIKKTLIPIEQKEKGLWSKGDTARIRLELESQTDMTWVVVNDPIPAGSMILGSGLGRDSNLLSSSESERGWAWETYRERSFEALRVYYEYVPKGKWTIEYTLRLNNSGTFYLPETRVEALYSPEMFGEIPNRKMEVKGLQ
jgi:hypothetical protein